MSAIFTIPDANCQYNKYSHTRTATLENIYHNDDVAIIAATKDNHNNKTVFSPKA